MRIFILSLLIIIFHFGLMGQSGTITIKKSNLEEKKFYSVNCRSTTTGGVTTYELNGIRVDKETYDRYQSTWKIMEECCPCILKEYDMEERLLREGVACTDCGAGWYKEYYLNGNLRLTGHFRENNTGNWNDIWKRGYCNVKDDKWTYYNEDGDSLYSEYWNNGIFVEQIPEQPEVEIWNASIFLNGANADSLEMTVEEINKIKVVPLYKNNNRSESLFLELRVGAIGHKNNSKEFSPEFFSFIDVNEMLNEAGIPKEKETSFTLILKDGDRLVKRFYLQVKK